MIRIKLPMHLQILARIKGEAHLEVPSPVTIHAVIDALEKQYPPLSGTIRDHFTRQRRPLIRFFACEEDISHDSLDIPLPEVIAHGEEPLWIVGAVAGG